MQLAMITNVVDHQSEAIRISINKYFIIHILQLVSTRKHCLKCTTLDLAQSRLSYTEVIFTADIELDNIVNGLNVGNAVLFLCPGILFMLQLLPLELYSTDFVLNFTQQGCFSFLDYLELLLQLIPALIDPTDHILALLLEQPLLHHEHPFLFLR